MSAVVTALVGVGSSLLQGWMSDADGVAGGNTRTEIVEKFRYHMKEPVSADRKRYILNWIATAFKYKNRADFLTDAGIREFVKKYKNTPYPVTVADLVNVGAMTVASEVNVENGGSAGDVMSPTPLTDNKLVGADGTPVVQANPPAPGVVSGSAGDSLSASGVVSWVKSHLYIVLGVVAVVVFFLFRRSGGGKKSRGRNYRRY